MTRSLILDTNVFYNLGAGRLKKETFQCAGDTLCFSPISVVELAGKWSDKTHSARKSAAQAILDSGAVELPDPEAHLTLSFGYPLAQVRTPMLHAVLGMAASSNLAELQSGVRDYKERVSRRVSVTAARGWRSSTEGKWVADMVSVMRAEIPKFAAWYSTAPSQRRGPVPKLRGAAKAAFLAATTSSEWFTALTVGCQSRALLGTHRGPHLIPNAAQVPALLKGIHGVAAYCAIYTQYLCRLLADGALPEPNDSGDLELFLYAIDDDHVVVTSERKWVVLAARAGYPQRVLHV